MVGQRFVSLLERHPWFEVVELGSLSPLRRQNLPGRLWAAAGLCPLQFRLPWQIW